MKILFHLPASTLARCFRERDLDRLREGHEVMFTDGEAGRFRDADAVVAGWGTAALTDAMLEAAPSLKVLVYAAGSVKHLLPATFWSRGIRLGTTNEALAVGVAETTLGLIIMGLKNVMPSAARTREGGWRDGDGRAGGFVVREMFGVTIGVIGASQCGRHVLRLLRNFEVEVLLADPTLSAAQAGELGAALVPLDELMGRSDVVTLHAPALESTRHMIGRRQFGAMRDGAIFINTARGMIVDEAALVAELRTGRIAAILDVTDPEPPAAEHPFRSLGNCTLLPHIAGAVTNGCYRMGRSAVDQLLEFAAGKVMHGEVARGKLGEMA